MKTIEVFRTGTFQPMAGPAVTFSLDDLQAIADAYDYAGAPAPVVVGHPKHDSPAYGWIKSMRVAGEKLLADIGDLADAFSEAVAEGRYKKVSMSFFKPDAPNNPAPGGYYPKHVGFLGGAAPAVSGLKPVDLADDAGDALSFEFADPAFKDVAGMFRRFRDFMIDQFGLEKADEVMPDYQIRWIDDAGDVPASATPAYTEPNEVSNMTQPGQPDPNRGADLDAREAALAEREAAVVHDENVAFVDKLIGDGKFLPALQPQAVALLDALAVSAEVEVSFADADGKAVKAGLAETAKAIFAAAPKLVEFGQTDVGDEATAGNTDFAAPAGATVDGERMEIHQKALAYQTAHPETSYLAAVRAVEAGA